MTLGRRMALLMAAVVLLSLVGGPGRADPWPPRDALQRELQRRSLEAARSLAGVAGRAGR
jgi:hypothetical protein